MTETEQLAEIEEPDGPGDLLVDLNVMQLRRFLVGILKAGGVPRRRMAEAMRCSIPTILRDARSKDDECEE